MSQQVFETRLQLSQLLLQTGDAEERALAMELLDGLHAEVERLNQREEMKRFRVGMQKEHVDAFQDRGRWNNLSNDDIHRINTYLSDLPQPESVHESARRFDLMMLKMQVARLLQLNRDVERLENRLVETANALGHKFGVPEVIPTRGVDRCIAGSRLLPRPHPAETRGNPDGDPRTAPVPGAREAGDRLHGL